MAKKKKNPFASYLQRDEQILWLGDHEENLNIRDYMPISNPIVLVFLYGWLFAMCGACFFVWQSSGLTLESTSSNVENRLIMDVLVFILLPVLLPLYRIL